MKRLILFIPVIVVSFLLSCTTKEARLVKMEGRALGTYYTIQYYDVEGRNLQVQLDSVFSVFNHVLSIYDSTSQISQFNRNEPFKPHAWFEEVFRVSDTIYKATEGAFDPSVGPLVNAWGFGFTNADSMSQSKVDSILEFVGFDKVTLENGVFSKGDYRMVLDFNAIAKGYCSDIAGAYLESMGITAYLVEIGGEIVSRGSKPDGSLWKVGIEKPASHATDAQSVMQVINITGKALATSGNYRRYFEKDGHRYSHTINPSTGFPAENTLLSATVIADRCITADAFATAFMVMGTEKALAFANARKDIEAFFISSCPDSTFVMSYSEGFEAYLAE